MNFTVKFADKYIKIDSQYPDLKNFCKDYLVEDGPIDFSITLTQEDILHEQNLCQDMEYPLSYLETLATLRKIAETLPSLKRFLMHGASITYDDKAYLFTAPSGTGKSTHIRLWKKCLGERVRIVNGDKPFLSFDDGEVRIYGTPWAGKERWQRNCSATLHGICFVNRGTENKIRKLEPSECLTQLFKQIYLPADSEAAGATLELMDVLVRTVPLYYLECDMSEDAVRCSFEALTGLKYSDNKLK